MDSLIVQCSTIQGETQGRGLPMSKATVTYDTIQLSGTRIFEFLLFASINMRSLSTRGYFRVTLVLPFDQSWAFLTEDATGWIWWLL